MLEHLTGRTTKTPVKEEIMANETVLNIEDKGKGIDQGDLYAALCNLEKAYREDVYPHIEMLDFLERTIDSGGDLSPFDYTSEASDPCRHAICRIIREASFAVGFFSKKVADARESWLKAHREELKAKYKAEDADRHCRYVIEDIEKLPPDRFAEVMEYFNKKDAQESLDSV